MIQFYHHSLAKPIPYDPFLSHTHPAKFQLRYPQLFAHFTLPPKQLLVAGMNLLTDELVS